MFWNWIVGLYTIAHHVRRLFISISLEALLLTVSVFQIVIVSVFQIAIVSQNVTVIVVSFVCLSLVRWKKEGRSDPKCIINFLCCVLRRPQVPGPVVVLRWSPSFHSSPPHIIMHHTHHIAL